MTAQNIIQKYITYFKNRKHVQIPNSSLVPENDPTTLFTSSGMQPLVPYLLGEKHPAGKRLVDVQNSFRAVDIDEIGDNRHTTFFRMLGNWSLGDYFKTDQLTWCFDFLIDPIEGLELDPRRLYVTVFEGYQDIPKDDESIHIWETLFQNAGLTATVGERIFPYGVEKNWWSRSGSPDKMPEGEPGGPTSEVFYDFGEKFQFHEKSRWKDQKCHLNCDCGRYAEICNSVFMTYIKQEDGSLAPLPKPNVDFGAGLERLLIAVEHQPDVFQTNLLMPVVENIVEQTGTSYNGNETAMRIVTDHFVSSLFISAAGITPSNKDQGYVLRRLIRRGLDNFYSLRGKDITPILEMIVEQYRQTDAILIEKFEVIKNVVLEEEQKYQRVQAEARKFIEKKYDVGSLKKNISEGHSRPSPLLPKGERTGDEIMGEVWEITAADAFTLYTTHGLSPTQIKSLGYSFNDQKFADLMEAHQKLSRKGAEKKFAGGLADHSELTVKGHTATHLMHQALRDVLGNHVHQSGSNITSERVRFDFNFDRKLSVEEIAKVENIVNEKIKENLPVHYEMMPLDDAKKIGAIGLFDEKYGETVKVYFIGGSNPHDKPSRVPQHSPHLGSLPQGERKIKEGDANKNRAYSVEFCGGPHVEFTGQIKRFKIMKEEGLGKGMRRIYAKVE